VPGTNKKKYKSARHKEKKMPRLPRIYIEGAVYFITCRGENEQNIFNDEKDYLMFLELLKKYKDQYDIKIFGFVLMPNHLHLLIEMKANLPDGSAIKKSQEISEFMHSLNNAYTKYFNSRYGRKGHLFRERFKAALVEKENYLLKMTVYMHLNPEKLNLIPDSRNYPYSSYPSYLNQEIPGPTGINLKEEIREVFKLLGGKCYEEFVKEMTQEETEFLHRKLQRGGIVGSDEFERRVRSEIQAYQSQPQGQGQGVSGARYKLFVVSGSLLLVFAFSMIGAYFYFTNKSLKLKSVKMEFQGITKPEELDNTQWQVRLIPAGGGEEIIDTLSFLGGKFISAKLSSSGFSHSNCSITQESDGRIVWETMQSVGTGTASWHGEIEQGNMKGILSLREEGKPAQDFSFVSIQYKRKGR